MSNLAYVKKCRLHQIVVFDLGGIRITAWLHYVSVFE